MADPLSPTALSNQARKESQRDEESSSPIAEALALLRQLIHPKDAFGSPMLYASRSFCEVVPTQQYGNQSITATVAGFIPDGPDEQVKENIRRLGVIAEEILAEDRQKLQIELQTKAAAGQPR